jgi:3-oxoacyl-[acyl-carrier protein] reductase
MPNKIALVTGVSRIKGIGFEICNELANNGFDIFFTYWTPYDNSMPWKVAPDEQELIQKELEKHKVRLARLELDLSQETSVEKLLKKVNSTLGIPNVLVNNATYSTQTTVKALTAAELDMHYAINLKATTLLTLAFIRQFEAGKNGRIINISSGQSLGEMPNEIAYAITKGAIETLTKTISQEIAEKGITINAINPGPNDTGWMSDELKEQFTQQFPMKRLGTPNDVSKLVAFLASKDAEWITGQIIHVEGGFKR